MGDPHQPRKKYDTPMHPWQRARIEKERVFIYTYGLKNKKEIWKMDSRRKSFADQAKRLIAATGTQAEIERQLLFKRLTRLGFLTNPSPQLDDVLSLTLEDVMNRRLQSLVVKKGLARTMKQARQFITHQHVTVDGKGVTTPSYIVPITHEESISIINTSTLSSIEHPERVPIQRKAKKPRPQRRDEGRGGRRPRRGGPQ